MTSLLCLIVLAAGLSSRFGSNKLVEKLSGVPIIRRVVTSALNSEVDEVIVVLGHQSETVRQALEGLPCKFVLNQRYLEGQSSSVKAGLLAVKDRADAVLVLPGDLAHMTSEPINQVVREYMKDGDRIVVPSYRGRIGHPILVNRGLFNEMLEIKEDGSGLKGLLDRHPRDIIRVQVTLPEVLIDIDKPEDLQR